MIPIWEDVSLFVCAIEFLIVRLDVFWIGDEVLESIANEDRISKLVSLGTNFLTHLLILVGHIQSDEGFEENTVNFGLNSQGVLADCGRIDHIMDEHISENKRGNFM